MKSASEIRKIIKQYFPKYRPTTKKEFEKIGNTIKELMSHEKT